MKGDTRNSNFCLVFFCTFHKLLSLGFTAARVSPFFRVLDCMPVWAVVALLGGRRIVFRSKSGEEYFVSHVPHGHKFCGGRSEKLLYIAADTDVRP
eukprot:4021660-Amphidinium_carterae.1